MSNAGRLSKEIQTKYQEVGRFIDSFNALDARLGQVIGTLANKDDVAVGEIIGAAINSFPAKCNIVAALVGHRGGEDWNKKYKELDGALRKLNEARVDLAHGEHWLDFTEWRYRMRRQITTPKGFKSKHMEYSAAEIGKLAATALSLEADLYMFLRQMHLD